MFILRSRTREWPIRIRVALTTLQTTLNKVIRSQLFALIARATLLLFLAANFGCAESYFDLAPDSRLPRWFELPSSLTRADVTVRMTYYVRPSGRVATFALRDLSGKVISTASGTMRGLRPTMLGPNSEERPLRYPLFEIITVKGVTQVIEHPSVESIHFRMVEDLEIRRQIGAP